MTDTDYTFGAEQDPAGGKDNRGQYRLVARAQISLELEAGEPTEAGTAGASGRVLACAIRDISASGLSLLSDESLNPGALFPARVALGRGGDVFPLIVEVAWCRPCANGFLVGVRILESDQTAYVEWTEAVANAMETP